MIDTSEEALICDFAETYHIHDYTALPADYAGVLACGLRDDSRIKMLMSGQKVSMDLLMLAGIWDKMNILVWQNTEDGHKGRNFPEPILSSFVDLKRDSDALSFDSGAEFEAYRERLLNNG